MSVTMTCLLEQHTFIPLDCHMGMYRQCSKVTLDTVFYRAEYLPTTYVLQILSINLLRINRIVLV